ncbi:ATP-binding protein [Chitinivorax sp. B]|uniref:sensor histidine kinase n=1 Tax=Chitinivorax sp. B TaxID=2502235 RepID=UPI0010F82857|nr:ATP-binding protein [Chitinivorax sp. B]
MKWRPRLPGSLRARLILSSVLIEVVLLAVLIVNSIRLVNNAAQAGVEASLAQAVPMLNAAAIPYILQQDSVGLQDFLNVAVSEHRRELSYVVLTNLDGQRLATAGMPFHQPLPSPTRHIEQAISEGIYHISRPVVLAERTFGTMHLGISTRIIANTRRDLLRQGLMIAAIEVLLSILCLGWMGIWLTAHLRQTIDAGRDIANGDFSRRIPERGAREVVELAHTINQMSQELGHQMAALRASEYEYRVQFEQCGAGLAHIRADGSWLRFNEQFAGLLGFRNHEDAPPPADCWHPRDQHQVLLALNDLFDGAHAFWQNELRCLQADGGYRWVLCSLSLYRQPDLNAGYVIMALQDIARQKATEFELMQYQTELESRVAERTHALAVANQELEAFSYSVSHDLRAPLRAIASFTQLLIEDYKDQLSEEGRDLLDRIHRAALRQNNLIDALLDLSHVSQVRMRQQSLDLSALARTVIEELQASDPKRQVSIDIAPSLPAIGDPSLLQIALQNLLGNAWKYTAKTANPHITFSAQPSESGMVYQIIDNGAGFDPAFADKLFKPFQRLHDKTDFEGTGIGLATVTRIIRRHGGQVWAESRPGKGATFFFTLTIGSNSP